MSEVGNKATLRKVAGLMEMLDQKQFPSVLDIGDIKAVVDISKYLQEPYQEFLQLSGRDQAAGLAAKTDYNIMRVGGLTANGEGVNQYNMGNTRDVGGDPAQDELYNYRLLSVGFVITISGAELAAEVAAAGSINWEFFTSGSDVLATFVGSGSPQWYGFQYQGLPNGGLTFDTDIQEYNISLFSASSGPSSAPSSFPAWIPGFFGCGVDLTIRHRTGSPSGPAAAWLGAHNITKYAYGIRVPKSNGIIFG